MERLPFQILTSVVKFPKNLKEALKRNNKYLRPFYWSLGYSPRKLD